MDVGELSGNLYTMLPKRFTTRRQIYQITIEKKHDSTDLARQTRNDRKLNRIAIQNDERKALLTRLSKLQAENQKLAADSKQVYFDMQTCKEENTELIGKIKNYKEEMRMMNEIEYTKEVRREENTKLAQRLRSYEEKLKKAETQIVCGEEWKRKCKEIELENQQLKLKLETVESGKKTMEQTLTSLQKEIEIYQKTSLVTSCCFDLKVGNQKLEKEVDQLQTHINSLEKRLKTSKHVEEEFESTQRKLESAKKDLDVAENELRYCKIEMKDLKDENQSLRRKENDKSIKIGQPQQLQPNFNVHVHLDQQELLTKSSKQQQNQIQQKVEKIELQSSNEFAEKIEELRDEIQALNKEKELLEDRLKCFDENQEETGKKLIEIELSNLKKEQAFSLEENKRIESNNLKLKSEVKDLQKQIENYMFHESEMKKEICEFKGTLSEYETSENKLQKEIEELKETLTDLEKEFEGKEKDNKDEILKLRQQLHAQSNEDLDCLRKKIQDLTLKKEKNEKLMEKVREDKANLQMLVERLQKETDGLKKQIEKYNEG